MNDYATKDDVKEIVNEAVAGLAEIISSFATQVGQRFDDVDKRFEQVDKRFEQIDKTLESLDGRVGAVESGQRETNRRLAAMEQRFEHLEDQLTALDNDVKEIYRLLNKKQDKVVAVKSLTGKELEKYIVDTYSNIVKIARQNGIALPR